MKKNNYPKFGTILLGLAALVNLARWVGVFTVENNAPAWVWGIIPFLGAFSGLVTGLVIAGGLAFVAHRLGGLQPFTPKGRPVMRFWGAAMSGLAILVMSAFLLPPYVRMTMPEELRAEIGNTAAWSVMAVLVGDLIIVAIALADGKSAGFTRSADGRQSLSEPLSKGKIRSAKKGVRSGKFACRHAPQCERTFASQNAANGHARTCKFKPTISMPISMPVEEKAEKR